MYILRCYVTIVYCVSGVSTAAPAASPLITPVQRTAPLQASPKRQAQSPGGAPPDMVVLLQTGPTLRSAPPPSSTHQEPQNRSTLSYNPAPSPRRIPVSTSAKPTVTTATSTSPTSTTTPSLSYNPSPTPRRPISSAEQAKQDFLARTSAPDAGSVQPSTVGFTNNLNKPSSSITTTTTITNISTVTPQSNTTVHTQQRTSLTSRTVSSPPPVGGGGSLVEQFNAIARPPSVPSGEYQRIQREQQEKQQQQQAAVSSPPIVNQKPALRSPTETNHTPPVNGTQNKFPAEVILRCNNVFIAVLKRKGNWLAIKLV